MEEWKELTGIYKGYTVSTMGRIRGRKGIDLKTSAHNENTKLQYVYLDTIEGKKKVPLVKLVIETFLCKLEYPINYRLIDGNPLNLRLSNIQLFNEQEESRDKTLPNKNQIEELLDKGLTLTNIAKELNISYPVVARLISKYCLLHKSSSKSQNLTQSQTITEHKVEWRALLNSPYEISNMGDVRRADTKFKLSIPISKNKGCRVVTLSIPTKGQVSASVHKLVAQLFIPNPHEYKKITFIDGDRSNCKASNLAWVEHERRDAMFHSSVDLRKSYTQGVPNNVIKAIEDIINGEKVGVALHKNKCTSKFLESFGFPSSKRELVKEYEHHKEEGTLLNYLKGEYNVQRVERLEGEIFKPLANYPGYYISNKGRVLSRILFKKERLIKLSKNKSSGYSLPINLNSVKFCLSVRKLVAETFLTNPNNYTHVINLDGDVWNCEAENLAYVSREKYNRYAKAKRGNKE